MTWKPTLILCAALATLASCVSPASNCAGWQKIQAGEASVEWLAGHDPAFLRQVIAHDEFGAKRRCWP